MCWKGNYWWSYCSRMVSPIEDRDALVSGAKICHAFGARASVRQYRSSYSASSTESCDSAFRMATRSFRLRRSRPVCWFVGNALCEKRSHRRQFFELCPARCPAKGRQSVGSPQRIQEDILLSQYLVDLFRSGRACGLNPGVYGALGRPFSKSSLRIAADQSSWCLFGHDRVLGRGKPHLWGTVRQDR